MRILHMKDQTNITNMAQVIFKANELQQTIDDLAYNEYRHMPQTQKELIDCIYDMLSQLKQTRKD